jgi:hypothetical protein
MEAGQPQVDHTSGFTPTSCDVTRRAGFGPDLRPSSGRLLHEVLLDHGTSSAGFVKTTNEAGLLAQLFHHKSSETQGGEDTRNYQRPSRIFNHFHGVWGGPRLYRRDIQQEVVRCGLCLGEDIQLSGTVYIPERDLGKTSPANNLDRKPLFALNHVCARLEEGWVFAHCIRAATRLVITALLPLLDTRLRACRCDGRKEFQSGSHQWPG